MPFDTSHLSGATRRPGAREMTALLAGQSPHPKLDKAGKARSVHNTSLTLPVVVLMISNHFPGTYDWRVVCLLVLAGWGGAKFVRKA